MAGWRAYADYLAERGDPRGEFMQVQLALEDESRPAAERKKLAAREKALLKKHERDWLGAVGPVSWTPNAPSDGRQAAPSAGRRTVRRGWLGRPGVPPT